MSDPILTPLEQSIADTGRRFFKVESNTYDQMAAGVDQIRGYPHGQPSKVVTLRGLPARLNLPITNDGSGSVLVSLETWRFSAADDALMAPAIAALLITELTKLEYEALKPTDEET